MGVSLPRCLSCGLFYYVKLLATENNVCTHITSHVTGHVVLESTEKVLIFSVDYVYRFHINGTTKRIRFFHWMETRFRVNSTFIYIYI